MTGISKSIAEDIIRYGVRKNEIEIDICTHQYIYIYENQFYLITMFHGNIISCFLLA